MKEQIEILVNLQNIESAASVLTAELDMVPQKLEALDAELKAYEKGIENESVQLDTLKKEYREFEADIQMNLSQIKKSQDKLRSVKTNKEYQSSLKEIEDVENKSSLIEDEMIRCLEQMEVAEKVIASRKEEFIEFNDLIRNEIIFTEQKAAQNKKKLSELEIEREKVSLRVKPELVEKYTFVKNKVKGAAVAAVSGAICQGCNLNIPPQMYNDLQRSNTLNFCPHCQRIIYWKEM